MSEDSEDEAEDPTKALKAEIEELTLGIEAREREYLDLEKTLVAVQAELQKCSKQRKDLNTKLAAADTEIEQLRRCLGLPT